MGRIYLRILFCFDLLLICYFYLNVVMLMGMFWQYQAVDLERTGVSIVLPAVKKRSLLLSLLKRRTRYKDKIRIKLWSTTAHIVHSHLNIVNVTILFRLSQKDQQEQNSTALPSKLLQILHKYRLSCDKNVDSVWRAHNDSRHKTVC